MTSNSFAPNRIDTLIGASTRIDGNIACTGVLRVQGEVAGDVLCHEGPTGGLIVDSAGSVAGATDAPHIVVRGRVAGPTHSSQSIEIHQGASMIGDVSFRQLAIHAGGVVEGALNPTADDADPAPSQTDAPADERQSGGKRTIGIAAALAVVAVVVAWAAGWLPSAAPPQQDIAPSAAAPAPEPERPAPAARPQPLPAAPAVVERAPADAVATAAEQQQAQREETVTVNGANPSRPTGVFLLIAHEPAVLYRKRRDDAGAGTRLSAEAGEKVSISVDDGELIRVAKGSALEIYYQGQKVPRNIVERGVWISFVPKPKPGKPGS